MLESEMSYLWNSQNWWHRIFCRIEQYKLCKIFIYDWKH